MRDREIESEQAREIKIESERSSAKEMTRERERGRVRWRGEIAGFHERVFKLKQRVHMKRNLN